MPIALPQAIRTLLAEKAYGHVSRRCFLEFDSDIGDIV
jgi:hypothetical protein